MTVAELLKGLSDAYPGFTPAAAETWAPVFRARFAHREGPKLADAFAATLAEFQPKSTKPHPIPVDVEANMPHMPEGPKGESGPPIREALERRKVRADRLFTDWHSGQGAKIKAARPMDVYGCCVILVHELARRADERTARIILSAEQIAACEHRAMCGRRVHRFGRLPKTNEEWQAQIEKVRNPEQAAA